MSHRWSPGSSKFIRIIDCGFTVVWVRPETDGVTVVVYTGDGFGNLADQRRAEIWTVRLGHGSPLLDIIRDKVHRIRWVRDVCDAAVDDYKLMSWSRAEVAPSHHGHRRLNRRRSLWLDPLPRRIRDAIGQDRWAS
ncbi:hypothetical protein ACTOB_003679 [Actinoplanes oblitus]|uniref:Uncharacterized protein n=1 Tax=Actinoplanes oblitus TaxID=3040509 RepID=A0ABY8WVG0_9ACTN|nr:hypothetical protein [Actinoplanes oblitus]WIN00006.1 hypothetical protein ACTOB_003679 [Actinoplanes oblitus]